MTNSITTYDNSFSFSLTEFNKMNAGWVTLIGTASEEVPDNVLPFHTILNDRYDFYDKKAVNSICIVVVV